MPTLPPVNDFVNDMRTEGQMKITFADLREYLAGVLGTDGTAATALNVLGAMISSYSTRTAAYTVNLGDRGAMITASNTWTLTLPAAATAGAGFALVLHNGGTGIITLDPDASELIDDIFATIQTGPGRSVLLICTGTAWITLGFSGGVTEVLGPADGGTGVANNAAATLTRSGNHALTLTTTTTTDVTLPATNGTLSTLAGTEILTNKTLSSPVITAGITGTAVTQTTTDTTAGRLVKVRDSTSVLAQVAALSVLGNGTNATADIAAIAAVSDHQVMRRSGTEVAFGAVALAQANAVTGALGAANGGTGIANNAAATLTRSGDHALTLTTTGTTAVTLPLTGTLVTMAGTATLTNKTINLDFNTLVATSAQLAAALTDETGTGVAVFSVSPALTGTPTAPTAAPATDTTQVATAAHVFAERANTATLTNKTLTSPVIDTGITGTAITQSATDTTAGRLVKVRDSTSVLAQIAALSVLGNVTNATADIAAIAAALDHQVLRRSGTAVAFGAIQLGQSASVGGTLSPANGGTGVGNNSAATLVRSGNFALTLTTTAVTGVTLPTTGTLATLAGTETLTNKTLASPVINTSITGTAVTQTNIDNTTGRVLKVGDFALGGTVPYVTAANALNDITTTGFYGASTVNAPTVGAPSGAVGGVILTIVFGGTNRFQVYTEIAGAGRQWERHLNTTWTAWRETYNQNSILGTVSQAVGVPTGALMQYGSSANGFFERRASGWAECTRTDQTTPDVSTAYGSLFRSADIVWTFPTAFFAGTLPAVAFSADNADVIGFRVISLSATAVTFQLVANASIAGTTTVRASAIGRWSDMI